MAFDEEDSFQSDQSFGSFAGRRRHRDVYERHIRPAFLYQLYGLRAIRRRAHHLYLRPSSQQGLQTSARVRLVIDDQNMYALVHRRHAFTLNVGHWYGRRFTLSGGSAPTLFEPLECALHTASGQGNARVGANSLIRNRRLRFEFIQLG